MRPFHGLLTYGNLLTPKAQVAGEIDDLPDPNTGQREGWFRPIDGINFSDGDQGELEEQGSLQMTHQIIIIEVLHDRISFYTHADKTPKRRSVLAWLAAGAATLLSLTSRETRANRPHCARCDRAAKAYLVQRFQDGALLFKEKCLACSSEKYRLYQEVEFDHRGIGVFKITSIAAHEVEAFVQRRLAA